MVPAGLLRQAWIGLLAGLPRPVLAWLDGWAERQASRRADKRRRALLTARTRS